MEIEDTFNVSASGGNRFNSSNARGNVSAPTQALDSVPFQAGVGSI